MNEMDLYQPLARYEGDQLLVPMISIATETTTTEMSPPSTTTYQIYTKTVREEEWTRDFKATLCITSRYIVRISHDTIVDNVKSLCLVKSHDGVDVDGINTVESSLETPVDGCGFVYTAKLRMTTISHAHFKATFNLRVEFESGFVLLSKPFRILARMNDEEREMGNRVYKAPTWFKITPAEAHMFFTIQESIPPERLRELYRVVYSMRRRQCAKQQK